MWIQYIEMVALLRLYIRAERTGDWYLHLKTSRDMLPYFAAAGHNNYTKSLWCYLQDMDDLKKTNPTVYQSFEDGQHIIRRTDRFWGGVSLDQVIEQDLMRSMKTLGTISRPRRKIWHCSSVN